MDLIIKELLIKVNLNRISMILDEKKPEKRNKVIKGYQNSTFWKTQTIAHQKTQQ